MPVSETYKVIFVHIPKTGGTSIEFILGMHGEKRDIGIRPYPVQKKNHKTLFGNGLQHLTAREIFYILACRASTIFSASGIHLRFSNLLDPANYPAEFDDIRKHYYVFTVVRNPYDRLVSQMAWSEGKWYEGKQLEIGAFKSSAKRTLSMPSKKIPDRFKPQHSYIFANNRKLVDDIYHFENFEVVSAQMHARFDLNVEIPIRMRSCHRPWEEYYDDELKEMVSDFYDKDFTLFGYDK